MSRAFENEASDFEFNPEMGEFGESEYGEGEDEFGEAEFGEAEVRDHRRRLPSPPLRGYPQRPYALRVSRPPLRYPPSSQVSRHYAARPYRSPVYGSRPNGGTRWWPARTVYRPQYSGTQRPVRYGYWQQPYAVGLAPRWRGWRRWSGGGSPYGQMPYPQPYDEPQYPEPAYVEPPPPPPPMVQMAPPPVAEPPGPMPSEPPAPMPTGQSGAGELYIEPEAFEFEPELDLMFEESGYEADFESEAPGSSSFALLQAIPDNANYARFVPLDYRLDAKAIVGKLSTDLEQLKDPSAKDLRKFAEQVFKFVAGGSPVKLMLNILVGALKNIPGGYLAAAAKIADDWAARGFSRGVVLGANGKSQSYLIDTFGRELIPPNDFFPAGRKIAAANYGAGLVAGYVQGKALSKNQHVIFWRDLGRRMGNQSYRGDQSTWSAKQWQWWYVEAAAVFRRDHL